MDGNDALVGLVTYHVETHRSQVSTKQCSGTLSFPVFSLSKYTPRHPVSYWLQLSLFVNDHYVPYLCSSTSQHGPLWSADIQRMQIHALVGAWYSSYDLSLSSRPRTCLATIYITAYGSGPTRKCEENNPTTTTNVNRSHHELSTSQHSGQILRP